MKRKYLKHIILKDFGEEGQRKISKSAVLIIGCGALGSSVSGFLVRAGVGNITIADRDRVEEGNLQRQLLFDESDIGKSKAKTACEKLKRINSEVNISCASEDIMSSNIEDFVKGKDLVIDATDNIATRMIINDACVKNGIPWIYGGVLGSAGMSYSIFPSGPCLRCIMPDIPVSGEIPGCDTYGVINTIPAVIGAIQSTQAMKILIGDKPETSMVRFDIWENDFSLIEVEKNSDCECCVKKNFEFLKIKKSESVSVLCDNSVQIVPPQSESLDLRKIFDNLEGIYESDLNELMLTFEMDKKEITLFRNGRMIVKGTEDKGVARSIYYRVLGL